MNLVAVIYLDYIIKNTNFSIQSTILNMVERENAEIIVQNLNNNTIFTPKKLVNPCFSKTQRATIFFECIENNLF